MFSILTALVVAVAVVFGGAGATAYAAQESLPDQALYPVKIYTEELRLNLAADPEGQINLLLNFADQRVDEIAALLSKGEPVSQEVQERFQQQMENTLKVAAGLDDENMVKYMAMIQLRAYQQLRIMEQVQLKNPGQGVMTQHRVQAVIREQLGLLMLGLQDPQEFKHQFQHGFQHQIQYHQGISGTITGTLPVTGTFGTQNQFQYQHQFQNHFGISGTITGTVPITDTPGMQYGPYGPAGDHYQPGPDAGPGAGPGPGGEDGGSETPPDPGSGGDNGNSSGPTNVRDDHHSSDNDNGGSSDNGGGSDNGGSSGGDNGGGNGGGN